MKVSRILRRPLAMLLTVVMCFSTFGITTVGASEDVAEETAVTVSDVQENVPGNPSDIAAEEPAGEEIPADTVPESTEQTVEDSETADAVPETQGSETEDATAISEEETAADNPAAAGDEPSTEEPSQDASAETDDPTAEVEETLRVSVKVVWADNDNQSSGRPEKIKVTLLANGAPAAVPEGEINPVTLNCLPTEDGTAAAAAAVWANLPKSADGEEIIYTVKESGETDGKATWQNDVEYTVTLTGTVAEGFIITNTCAAEAETEETAKEADDLISFFAVGAALSGDTTGYGSGGSGGGDQPETIDLTVTKLWRDRNNTDGTRPKSVTVKLYANDEQISRSKLNRSNGWTFTVSGLDKYDEDGNPIEYRWEEVVPDGYMASYETDGIVTTITNIEVTSATVTKAWVDADNQDGIRPESINVYLLKNGSRTGQYVTLSEENGWTAAIENLRVWNNGEENDYSWEEVETSGYSMTGYDVDDTLTTITNSHTPKAVSVSVEKVWDDADNYDNIRPEYIEVTLLANGEPAEVGEGQENPVQLQGTSEDYKLSYTWENLPQYAGGEKITYTIQENPIPDGYEASVTGSVADGFTLTNSHTSEPTSVSVTKEWDDEDNQDGIRPSAISATLVINGTPSTDPAQTVLLNEENDWTYTFTDLDQYSGGEKIVYTVQENPVPDGYEASVTGSMADGFIIINSHTPAVTEVSGSKTWDDAGNQDGKRPGFIVIRLWSETGDDSRTKVDSKTVTANDNWSWSWTNLPVYEDGQKITYSISEDAVENYNPADIQGYNVTNSYTPKKTSVSVYKDWDDDSDRDGIRPESVTVTLYKDNVKTDYELILNEENGWSATFTDLDMYRPEGTRIEYTVQESGVPDGYISSVSGDAAKGFTITNTYTPAAVSVSVSKTWSDANNQDGGRPETIEVTLLADGSIANVAEGESNPITLNGTSTEYGLTYTWHNLPKYSNGKEITYTVKETGEENGKAAWQNGIEYTVAVTGTAETGFMITNSHTPETVDIPVAKVWKDNDNQDGIRPANIIATLYKGDTALQIKVLNEENNWKDTFTGLTKYCDGKEITYTVKEIESYVPAGYEAEVTGSVSEGFTITNTHTPATISIPVSKTWSDNDNQDGKRPSGVTVNLYADGSEDIVKSLTLNADNGWAATFTDLPKYAGGQEITYTIQEAEVSGYTAGVTGSMSEGFRITNTHTPEQTEIKVSKVWNDADNQDGIRPTYVYVSLYSNESPDTALQTQVLSKDNGWSAAFTGLTKYRDGKAIEYTVKEAEVSGYTAKTTGSMSEGFTITNTHTPATVSIPVSKTWSDNDNQDGKRPSGVTVNLYADGSADPVKSLTLNADNDWSATFTGLPKYAAGQEITYTVQETEVSGYTPEITGSMSAGFKVTNSHTPELTEIKVSKVWSDADNQDGIRPSYVKVILCANGKETDQSVLLWAGNEWTYTFTGLNKYSDGKEIEYTVKEDAVSGYEPAISGSMSAGFTITNTHTPATISIPVSKTWSDNDNQDGIRPSGITVVLYKGGEKTTSTLTLNEKNSWSASFENLPKYAAGQEITYTVQEENVDGYTASVTGSMADGFTITNSHTPAVLAELSGSKTWDDDYNRDGARPSSITIRLHADGTEIDSKTVTAGDGWYWSWTNLPVYNHGKEITYTVTEDAVDNYTAKVDGFNVTNTHTPAQTSVSVSKVWDDADNQDGIRPESVTVTLYANGETTGMTLTLSEENKWTGTFGSLNMYEPEGKAIEYTVQEAEVKGYGTAIISGDAKTGYTITNPHTPEKVSVSVNKTWDDADNQDGIRPESVTVTLYADGESTEKTLTLSETNKWTGTFEGLDKFKQGKEIQYTIQEEAVEKYTADITGTAAEGYTVTNSHVPYTVKVEGQKIWSDSNDTAGYRPESITVYLLANGTKVEGKSKTVTAAGNWSWSFTDLPKNENGKEIEYTVEEDAVRYYKAAYSTTVDEETNTVTANITNTIDTTFGSLTISKKVSGNRASKTKYFTFTVYFNSDETFEYTGSHSGTIRSGESISLKHGEYITIKNIPNGTTYGVTEAGSTGYTVYASGNSGTIKGNATCTAAFTNYRSSVPKTGDDSHLGAWYSLLGLFGIGMGGSAYVMKRRKRKDEPEEK